MVLRGEISLDEITMDDKDDLQVIPEVVLPLKHSTIKLISSFITFLFKLLAHTGCMPTASCFCSGFGYRARRMATMA